MKTAPRAIAFFVISSELGGAETSLLHFLADRSPQGSMAATVYVAKAHGPLVDALQKIGVPVVSLDLSPKLLKLSRKNRLHFVLWSLPLLFFATSALLKIHKLTKGKDFQSFHSTGLKFHLLLGLFCLFTGQKLFIHIRDIFKSKIILGVFSFLAKRTHIQFISNSKATQKALLPTPSTVHYNGFDVSDFSPRKDQSLRQELGLPPQGRVVGIVGVIARWKGQREFLRLAKNLAPGFPDTFFWIVGSEIYDTGGEAGELAYLKNWVRENGLQRRVLFSPFQNPVQPVYSSLDILVHASTTPEPFGRVLVEAMMSGVPVVAADQGGPLEIVQDGSNGLLYPMGDVEQMTKRVQDLLANPKQRDALSSEALKIAQAFDAKKVHKDLEALLVAPT